MKRRIYALDAAIKELRGASGSWITWTDQEGGHTRPWYELEHILYAAPVSYTHLDVYKRQVLE